MTKHTRRDPAQYEALLNRRQDERLTFAQLSEDSGVPVATLQYWARKFRERDERSVVADDSPGSAFLAVDLSATSDTGIEVVLASDVRVAIKPGFDPATLRAVVDAFTC